MERLLEMMITLQFYLEKLLSRPVSLLDGTAFIPFFWEPSTIMPVSSPEEGRQMCDLLATKVWLPFKFGVNGHNSSDAKFQEDSKQRQLLSLHPSGAGLTSAEDVEVYFKTCMKHHFLEIVPFHFENLEKKKNFQNTQKGKENRGGEKKLLSSVILCIMIKGNFKNAWVEFINR